MYVVVEQDFKVLSIFKAAKVTNRMTKVLFCFRKKMGDESGTNELNFST